MEYTWRMSMLVAMLNNKGDVWGSVSSIQCLFALALDIFLH